jgi:hypothetical protein
LSGRVLDAAANPAANALLLIAVDEDSRKHIDGVREVRKADGDKRLDREGFFVRAGPDGAFATSEVPWGDVVILARGAGASARAVGSTSVHLPAGGQANATVTLRPGAALVGSIRDEAGKPCAACAFTVEWRGSETLGSIEHRRGLEIVNTDAKTAGDGSFRVEGLVPGYVRLAGPGLEKAKPRLEVELAEGAVQRIDVVVPSSVTLVVRVVDGAGKALRGWRVDAAQRPHSSHRQRHARTDAAGECRFAGLEPVGHTVCVHAPDAGDALGFARFPLVIRPWSGEAGPLTVTVPAAPATATVRGRVVDHAGQPVARAGLELSIPDFGDSTRLESGASGEIECAALPPGRYSIVARAGRHPATRWGPFELGPGERKDLGDLKLPAAAQLAVEAEPPPGAGPLALWLVGGEERVQLGLRSGGKAFTSGTLAVGRYALSLTGKGVAPLLREVVLEAGETKVRLTPEAAEEQPLVVDCSVDPETVQRGEAYAWIDLWDAKGTRLLDRHYLHGRYADGCVHDSLWLVPGEYRASVRRRRGPTETRLVVEAGPRKPIRIVLRE